MTCVIKSGARALQLLMGLACLVWVIAAAAACAGGAEPAAPRRPLAIKASDLSAAKIPRKRVAGELLGRPFTARDARFHIIEMPGRERVDLVLSERPIEQCGVPGQPVDDRSRRVWFRALGQVELSPGEFRVEPDGQGQLSAHYEVFEDGHWRGAEAAAALLVVDTGGEGINNVRLQACFDDGSASCVAGQIAASSCRSSIDIDMLGERFTAHDVEPQ